jgi:transposase InsO family protein
VQHCIITTGHPVFARARRLDPARYAVARAEFDQLLRLGVIRPSDSPWASPLHVVRKKDNSWRSCGDYRNINAKTTPDRYPIPHAQDLFHRLPKATIFSRIDLYKAFYQIPVAPEDVPKTAVITPFGLFEFLRMPFGLSNAAQSFQRFIDGALRGLPPRIFAYVDDILIASESPEQHEADLALVMGVLKEHGLVLNPKKTLLRQVHIEFLGHELSATGIRPLQDKVAAISTFAKPTSPKALRRFLGMLNFYRRFLPNLADVVDTLNKAAACEGSALSWDPGLESAFAAARSALATATELQYFRPSAPTRLVTDASGVAVGAVLEQISRESSGWLPVAFFSKSLSDTERRYATFDRELLAIVLAIRHFRHMLEARSFHVLTDHKPITLAMHKTAELLSPRQERHLAFVSQFTTDIQYVKGDTNVVADALSRTELAATTLVDSLLEDIATAQTADPLCQRLRNNRTAASTFTMHTFPGIDCPVLSSNKFGRLRPVVPESLRGRVIDALHSVAHPGIHRSTVLVQQHYMWPGMAKDIRTHVQQCCSCQAAKTHRHTQVPFQPFEVPDERFGHIHLDIVGPLPDSHGYRYLVTVVDRFTRWPVAIPTTNIQAETVAQALLSGWIQTFGIPSSLTTDRGRQFESALWECLTRWLGISHRTTTAWHPQANAQVERFHRTLKDALRARSADSGWLDHLPLVMLGIRNLPVAESGLSPAQLTFGAPVRLPGCFATGSEAPRSTHELIDRLRAVIRNLQPPLHNWHSHTGLPGYRNPRLDTSSHVYIRTENRHGLEPAYRGPYRVVQRQEKFFTLDMDGKEDTVSCDRLKPAILPGLAQSFEMPDNGKFKTSSRGRLIVRPGRYDT